MTMKTDYGIYHAIKANHLGYKWEDYDTYEKAISSNPHWIIKGKVIYEDGNEEKSGR